MIDLEALGRYNAGVLRAREEYYWHKLTMSCNYSCKCPAMTKKREKRKR